MFPIDGLYDVLDKALWSCLWPWPSISPGEVRSQQKRARARPLDTESWGRDRWNVQSMSVNNRLENQRVGGLWRALTNAHSSHLPTSAITKRKWCHSGTRKNVAFLAHLPLLVPLHPDLAGAKLASKNRVGKRKTERKTPLCSRTRLLEGTNFEWNSDSGVIIWLNYFSDYK